MNGTTVKSTARLVTSLALFVTTHVWGADSYWTGSGADNLFDNPDNWANGVPDGWFAVDPSQQSFSKYLMGLGTSIKNLSGVVYFNNGEEEFSVSADEGGGFSVSGNMYIGESGKTGDVCFNSGTYSVNDLSMSPANNSGKSTLTVDGAALNVRYWMYTSSDNAASESTIDLKSGSITTGAETSGNGNFYLCRANGSKGTVTQSGGTFLVQPRSDVYWGNPYGMVLGVGERSTATYTKTGGSLTVNGALRIGLGSSSNAAFVQKGGAEGNTTVTEANLDVGVASGATGLLAVSNGTITCKNSLNVAVSGGTGKFILAGGIVNVANCSYWAADTGSQSDVEISRGTLNFNGANDDWGALRILNGSNSTLTMDINGGTVNLNGDMQLGAGSSGNAEINISNGGVLCCGATDERWFKIGYGAGSKSTVNLLEGGLLDIWYMQHPSTGPSKLKFEGGTLRAKKTTDNLINDDNDGSFSVVIGDNGGYIDTQNHDVIIKKTMSGTGTLTKKGTGALTLTGSYGGGLAVAEDSGTVTTPGNQTLSAGQNVFLISKGVSELTAAQAATLAGDHPIWFESTGRIDLKDFTLDFSSATEQRLFAASSMTIDGTPVAADTDVSTHIHVLNATAAHKVVFKSGGIYAVADLTENKWIGGASGEWSTPSNWSEGVPTETSHVVFESSAVVLRSDKDLGKKCWIKLTLRNDAQVELRNNDPENYPSYEIGAGSLDGTGTLILTQCGLTAKTSNAEIPSTIKLVFQNTNGNSDGIGDCWLNDIGVSYAVTVNGPVEVRNYLVTRGGVVFNGAVTIKAGSRLYAGTGSLTVNGAVTIEGNGIFDMNPDVTFTKGESATLTETETDSGTASINAAVAEAFGITTTDNTWIGGSSGNWRTAYNWRYGVPAATQKVHVKNDCIIYFDGNWDAGKNDTSVAGALVVDAALTTQGPNVGDYKRVFLYGLDGETMVSGTGSITLKGNTGLENYSGSLQTLSCSVNFQSTDDHTWLGGTSGWIVQGNVVVDSKMQCDTPIEFRGAISGAGTIHVRNVAPNTVFSGDNRNFHGKVLKEGGANSYIDGVNAAGADVAWEIKGDMQVRNVSAGETIKFGSLDLAPAGNCVMYFPKDTSITVEVGSRNADMQFADGYWFWAAGETSDCNINFCKVGTGTLTSYVYNFKSMDVRNGRVILNNPTGALNTKSFTEIESVSVASGAVLGGNVGSTAGKLTISSLTLNPGAIVSQTVTENSGSYSCPTLTVNGSVDASGVKAKIANADFITGIMSGSDESAKTALKGTTFTLLSSTSMTGTPNPAVDGLGSEGINWYAVAQNNAMKILFGSSYSVEVGDGSAQSVQITDPGLAAWLTVNSATESVNTANANGVTGILAYMLGAEDYTNAAKPTMGATVADGVATLTFDDSAFRRVPGLKLAYYLESCDKADFSEAVTTGESSDKPAVQLEFANAKIFNRLCADVRASE